MLATLADNVPNTGNTGMSVKIVVLHLTFSTSEQRMLGDNISAFVSFCREVVLFLKVQNYKGNWNLE